MLSPVEELARALPKLPESDHFWMPVDAPVTAHAIDWLYDFLYWTSVISDAIVIVERWRTSSSCQGETPQRQRGPGEEPDHSTALEVTWSALLMFVLVAIFVWGFEAISICARCPSGRWKSAPPQ